MSDTRSEIMDMQRKWDEEEVNMTWSEQVRKELVSLIRLCTAFGITIDDTKVIDGHLARIRDITLGVVGEDEAEVKKKWDCACGSRHSLTENHDGRNRLRATIRKELGGE